MGIAIEKQRGAADEVLVQNNDAKDDSSAEIKHEHAAADVDFSDVDEKKVLRKMDIRLIPMLALLYLLSFLDRGNIGNAKIEGLDTDLGLTGPQYNWCCKSIPFCHCHSSSLSQMLTCKTRELAVTVFFFTYAAFEVPSNLLLKRLRPAICKDSLPINRFPATSCAWSSWSLC